MKTKAKTTLKSFRAQFTVGRRLEALEHWNPDNIGQRRTIDKVQIKTYRFRVDGQDKPGWSNFPSRGELELHDDGSFTIRPKGLAERGGFWRLRFID